MCASIQRVIQVTQDSVCTQRGGIGNTAGGGAGKVGARGRVRGWLGAAVGLREGGRAWGGRQGLGGFAEVVREGSCGGVNAGRGGAGQMCCWGRAGGGGHIRRQGVDVGEGDCGH